MTAAQTSRRRPGEEVGAGAPHPSHGEIREALGRASYERMRVAMLPDLTIATWDDLPERSREAYRRPLDWLVPTIAALTGLATYESRHTLEERLP